MKVPYKVLHVIDHLGTGGAQEVVCQLVRYRRAELFQPEVLTLRGFGHYWEVLRDLKIPVHSLFPEDPETFNHFGGLYVHLCARLLLFFKSNRYDIVHSHLLISIMFATPMAALSRQLIKINHEQVYDKVRHQTGEYKYFRKISNRVCDHIIAGSRSIREYLLEEERVPDEKVSLIYNAVELDRLCPESSPGEREKWREHWGVPKDALVVGGIGRLDPQKNFPLFLEVARELSRDYPHVCFLLAGDGPERQALEELSRHLGIREKVRFLGFVKELRELYLVLDVLLFPSRFEGTPLTVFGALAMGVPVVASRVDGIAETLEDGREAILIPPQDQEGFAAAVRRVLEDRELARRLAAQGQKTVREKFSAGEMVRQVEELYLRLLSQVGRAGAQPLPGLDSRGGA